jgi:hypothetical protein
VLAGAVGYAFSQRAVFLLVPVFAVLAAIAVLSIPAKAIDLNRARDLEREPDEAKGPAKAAGYSILFKSRPLIIFGVSPTFLILGGAALWHSLFLRRKCQKLSNEHRFPRRRL